MTADRLNKAIKLDEKDMEVILIGRKDETKDADIKYKNVQDLVAKICLLGQKRGRPRKDSDEYELAA